jgi:hypothetical protein
MRTYVCVTLFDKLLPKGFDLVELVVRKFMLNLLMK